MKIVLIISFFISFIFGQETPVQEKKLWTLEETYSIEKSKLDSINNALQIQIDELDLIKKQDKNSDSITGLMAQAHSVSKKADAQSEIVTNLAGQIKKLRLILYKKYSSSIDSLSKVGQRSDDEKLKELTFKRSLVSPALPLFSFDLGLIERIDLSNSQDNLEKSIHLDYLSFALSEIDSNITVIETKKDEVSTMIRLNEQTEDFVDDLDGAQFLSSVEFDTPDKSSNRTNEFLDNSGADMGPANLSESILQIYEQLQPVMNELIETPGIINTDSLASEDYLKLLQGTEKTLKLYRKIIQNKMDRN